MNIPELESTEFAKRYGFIYVVGCAEGFYKIGRCRYIDERIKQLRIQLPFKIDVIHMLFVTDPAAEERRIHGIFREKRVNGEWFKLDADDLDYIGKVLVFYSDLRLAGAYKRFTQQGNQAALRGVVDLYNSLPHHVIAVDVGVPQEPAGMVQ